MSSSRPSLSLRSSAPSSGSRMPTLSGTTKPASSKTTSPSALFPILTSSASVLVLLTSWKSIPSNFLILHLPINPPMSTSPSIPAAISKKMVSFAPPHFFTVSAFQISDLKTALGKKRKDGKSTHLQPLTTMQRLNMGRLIEKYSNDYQAMFMDTKLNKMQHPVATLKKLCKRYHKFGDKNPLILPN
ncbi:hypothetical protein CRYUN_Cryun14cG0087400 [Craigia yunnanensis]